MRVYRQALQSRLAQEVIVATDHPDIQSHVMAHGGRVVMTDITHPSGTDRIAEIAHKHCDADYLINVQGDEPMIEPDQIDQLIKTLHDSNATIATQCSLIEDVDQVFDYNIVKVVRDIHDHALYFSRQAIPAFRDLKYEFWPSMVPYYRHIGIYGFRRDTLLELTALSPMSYEKAESLEQLRWLQHGYKIHCAETSYKSIGVDTPDDVDRVSEILLTMGK
jgi:3-deoxy-manno-octulosonate cytidylyltransferase (CMP-KDO synthetase)